MILSTRYLLAFIVNVILPAAAYRVAFPYYGAIGALIASAVPLLTWMIVDLAQFRHFDALSALELAGIGMSLLLLIASPMQWGRAAREPLVSGIIGLLFLGSILLRRPLVFYLARSTMARERKGGELEFDAMWHSRPALVKSIRIMTATWGIGLVAENMARLWFTYNLSDDEAHRVSSYISYAAYVGLTVWTILYRRNYIGKQSAASIVG
ncbi:MULTISPECIES: VC0807 family protein [Paraburkholderia]|uniref:VC0807 family protein n=1 Tax=Paraburkholderia TaxID=1822464 RepID=UPI002258A0ED|nr:MULTISPECIES: VC0807 family protein [Paraburkholderia]MCX4174644.1 hypothetical protein [Paraburkholderia madseniana]MDQ6462645.1 hypothetical protein [Paraburkholderia madseniana]